VAVAVSMSPSTLLYRPRDGGNERLRKRLTVLAGQPRRHGYQMLHSRLRIDDWAIQVGAEIAVDTSIPGFASR
jgi:putative transposase